MPDLPTITVTDAQATRILAAYTAKFNTATQAETIAAFRKWLTDQIVTTVLTFEEERLHQEADVATHLAVAEIRQELPDPPAPPPVPTAEELERQALIAAQIASIQPT